jgi:adenylyltransferase/sulfurtransferase
MEVEREWKRYERQLGLIGKHGQKKLKRAKVFIAGAGGLGTAVLTYLAAAGIGKIEIVDKDSVHLSNLNRQILFSEKDVGKEKAWAAVKKLRSLNPHIELKAKTEDLLLTCLYERVSSFDVLVDALDNFSARYILNRASLHQGIPLIHGAVRGFYGQITTVLPGKTACLRCLFPGSPDLVQPSVLGPVCGLVGCLQATEVIKLILGLGSLLENRLLLYDGLRGTSEEVEVQRRPDCQDCGGPAFFMGNSRT